MKRRAFFARLAGAVAATAVAPAVAEAVKPIANSQQAVDTLTGSPFIGYVASDGPSFMVWLFRASDDRHADHHRLSILAIQHHVLSQY